MKDIIGQQLFLYDVVAFANFELTLGVINIYQENGEIVVVGIDENLKRHLYKTSNPQYTLLKIAHIHYKKLDNAYLDRIIALQKELMN